MGLFWIAFSQDVAAAEYSNLKWAMLEAIDAPGGVVTGTIVGPIADKFASTTGLRSLVMVEVTTVKNYRQDGCKRLNIRLKQANVSAKDGKSVSYTHLDVYKRQLYIYYSVSCNSTTCTPSVRGVSQGCNASSGSGSGSPLTLPMTKTVSNWTSDKCLALKARTQ